MNLDELEIKITMKGLDICQEAFYAKTQKEIDISQGKIEGLTWVMGIITNE